MQDKIKIAIVGSSGFDTLAWNFNYTFNKLGHESKIFDYGTTFERSFFKGELLNYGIRFFSSYENLIFNRLTKSILNFKPDLIIILYRNIPPFVVKNLRKDNLKKIIFLTGDALINLDRGYIFESEYDALFVKDFYMVRFMKDKTKLKVHYLPECFNPNFHKAEKDITYGSICDISVVGTLYPYRLKVIENLLSTNNYDLRLYGAYPRWLNKKWGKYHNSEYLTGIKKAEFFQGCKINLNIMHYSEINSGNCRLFEVVGSGGFQICDRKEAIKELFEEDKEIVMFDTIDELKEKIDYYLKNQDKAYEIALSGQKRALKEHTYEHRIKEIFRIIGLEK